MSRSTILIVEDEAIVAADLAAKLDHLGYEVIGSTARGEDAIAIARDKQPDIILMDIQLQGGMDGVEAATAIYRNFGLPFVYLTAHSDTATIERAKITESFGYILKPFEEREVGIAIEMALYKHQAEGRLRESEERCRALADASFDGVVVLEQSKVIDINSRGLAMLRWTREEMLGKDVVDVIGAELGTAATQQLNLGSEECHEGSLTRRDGSHLCIELRVRSAHFQGRPVHLASIRDVTESKRAQAARMKLEAQLRQSQKIQALGTLAGGIAHDFNNILTMILGNAELARMELPSDHEAREMLLQVLKAGYRARDLVDQILTFSRPREQLHAVVQLGPIIVDALNLLRASLPSTIQIHAEQPSREHGVLGDPVQIQQVLINVGNNAGHAMKATGGVLNFRQSLVQVEKNQFDVIPELAPGWYIRLDISDTGCGMDQATLERIFEPFFTTRPPGEGTGLGLAVTLGILQNHGGGISVHSEPGQGTTFGLYFRADVRAVTDPPASPAPSVGDKKGRGERVVVIDDEPDIAVLAGQILKRGGYAARVYTNPREALADLQAAPQSCDLVLTDLTMPGMTGMEVAKELRKIRPNLPIVLCTGFGHDLDASALNEAGIRAKLTKPFSVKALYELLNRLLSV